METEGKIILCKGNNAIVQIRRKGACGDNCAHCSGCTAQMMEIEAECDLSVSVGDWVRISSNRSSIFLGLFILFLMPVVFPLVVYLAAMGTGFEIWLAILALIISILLIIALNKSERFKNAAKPQVTDVIIKARKNDE